VLIGGLEIATLVFMSLGRKKTDQPGYDLKGEMYYPMKLRIVDTLMETNTKLIANKASWSNPAKRRKIEMIALLLQGALEAESKVGLKMNAPKKSLEAIIKAVPSLRNPTISPLSNPEWVALETIIDESVAREIIPQLKSLGAEGIVEYPLNKVVY